MREEKKSFIFKILGTLIVLFLVLFFLQKLLVPKYVTDIIEGNLVSEYYREDDKSFDVVFVGDCEVYENFSPTVLWDKYGINSYIRGSAQQYIFQSYYLLEDTLRFYKPKVAVFNVQSLQYPQSQSEAYNRMTLDDMAWSKSKVSSILASMRENENFIDYVFPILRYHSRWEELTASDLKYMFNKPVIFHNGYYMRVDVKPVTDLPKPRVLSDYSFGDNAWKYLDMMADLCKKEGIQLLLIKAPSLYPHWYDEWEEQVEEYAKNRGLPYINFLECIDDIGLDYDTDTYDTGLHMNLSGAEKLADYLGKILIEEYDVPDRRGQESLSNTWEIKKASYYEERDAQYKALEENKDVKNWRGL